MSDAQDDFPVGNAAPTSRGSAPAETIGSVATADGERCSQFGMGYDVGSDPYTLLSRAPAPQGRRSLFRR